MLNRRLSVGLTVCIIALLLIAGYFWRGRETPPLTQQPPSHAIATNPSPPSPGSTHYTRNLFQLASDKPTFDNKEVESRYGRIREQMLNANIPLSLFGRVVDQRGEPVAGVEVRFHVNYYNGIVRADFGYDQRYARVYTDDEGQFAVTDQTGIRLSIDKMTKEGYIFATEAENLGGAYTAYGGTFQGEPTQENPVLFQAWKMGETAALITDEKQWLYKQNEGFFRVDIPHTDGKIKVAFDVDEKGSRTNVLDWKITFKVLDGGLIESDAPFMYEAPETGYQTTWSRSYNGTIEGEATFYVKAGNTYARLKVRYRPYFSDRGGFGHGYLEVTYWVNPSGSRNLLYDEAKRIRVTR